jgi:hypothetical protein
MPSGLEVCREPKGFCPRQPFLDQCDVSVVILAPDGPAMGSGFAVNTIRLAIFFFHFCIGDIGRIWFVICGFFLKALYSM